MNIKKIPFSTLLLLQVASTRNSLRYGCKANRIWYVIIIGLLSLSWTLIPSLTYATSSVVGISTGGEIVRQVSKPLPIERQVPVTKAAGTIAFASSTYSVSEGIGTAVFTLTRSGGTVGTVSAGIVLTDMMMKA